MSTPLTSRAHSPGVNADFWLLGIGFIEISAIAAAIEIVVGILRTRPPGMTLDRMPIREQDESVHTVRGEIRVPTVIVAVNYAKVPKKRPKLCAKSIRERDGKRTVERVL